MFITSLLIGILVASLILLLWKDEPSLLMKRLKKTTKSGNFKKNVSYDMDTIAKNFLAKMKVSKSEISKTKKLLLQAGYASSDEDVVKFEAQRIKGLIFACILSGILLVTLFSKMILMACIILLIYMYDKPIFTIKKRIKFRQKDFMRYLPDAVDLLAICVQAGLGLDASFEKISEEFALTSQTISTEFERLNRDILSGINREDAYKNLLLRNPNPDLQSFVALLIQSEKLGTSITQSLDAFCDSLRTKKRQRIEELSQQASTKMTIPMVLFMLPAIFIIILYPAMQKIMVNLGHM